MTQKTPPTETVADMDQTESEEAAPEIENDSNAKAAPEDDTVNFLQAPKYAKMTQADDMGIVIVDDDIQIDQERINEERRAYLEEARSQEAFD